MTAEEKREKIFANAREFAEAFLEENPDFAELVSTYPLQLAIGEVSFLVEEVWREILPLDSLNYDAGQAAHSVRMKKMHAHVAEVKASA